MANLALFRSSMPAWFESAAGLWDFATPATTWDFRSTEAGTWCIHSKRRVCKLCRVAGAEPESTDVPDLLEIERGRHVVFSLDETIDLDGETVTRAEAMLPEFELADVLHYQEKPPRRSLRKGWRRWRSPFDGRTLAWSGPQEPIDAPAWVETVVAAVASAKRRLSEPNEDREGMARLAARPGAVIGPWAHVWQGPRLHWRRGTITFDSAELERYVRHVAPETPAWVSAELLGLSVTMVSGIAGGDDHQVSERTLARLLGDRYRFARWIRSRFIPELDRLAHYLDGKGYAGEEREKRPSGWSRREMELRQWIRWKFGAGPAPTPEFPMPDLRAMVASQASRATDVDCVIAEQQEPARWTSRRAMPAPEPTGVTLTARQPTRSAPPAGRLADGCGCPACRSSEPALLRPENAE